MAYAATTGIRDAVDVVVGDMVFDSASESHRDVDVTVTVREEDGSLRAFKAYEVKREGRPLDVATTEQLCAKLLDMTEITHRAIVSASGFTKTACAKAAAKGVELYELRRLPLGEDFSYFQVNGVQSNLLCWRSSHIHLVVPEAPGFSPEGSTALFSADASVHRRYVDLHSFVDAILMRSTELLYPLEPAATILRLFAFEASKNNPQFLVSPSWPHAHTLDVGNWGVYLAIGDRLAQVQQARISGELEWQRHCVVLSTWVLQQLPGGEAYAGAVIADWHSPDGKMSAFVLSPDSRVVGVHPVIVPARFKDCIRQLRVQ